jgi:hypothetical protein
MSPFPLPIVDAARIGRQIGHGQITYWELFQIIAKESRFTKARFLLDGEWRIFDRLDILNQIPDWAEYVL